MKVRTMFEVLNIGGTIHQIAREAKKNAREYYQQGRLCYDFSIGSMLFEGCVDGRLIAVVDDTVLDLPEFAAIVEICQTHKTIIEKEIFAS